MAVNALGIDEGLAEMAFLGSIERPWLVALAIKTKDVSLLKLNERRAVVWHEMRKRGIPFVFLRAFLPSEYLRKFGYKLGDKDE